MDLSDEYQAPRERWRSPWELDADLQDHGPVPKSARAPLPVKTKSIEAGPPVPASPKPTPVAPPSQPVREFDDISRAVNVAKSGPSMAAVVILASLVLIFSIVLFLLTRDEDPVWDEDLLPAAVVAEMTPGNVPPRAAERLRVLLDNTVPLSADVPVSRAPNLWSTPMLAYVVEQHATMLANLRDLVGEQEWQPHHPAWVARDFGNHVSWTTVTTVCAAAAAYQVRMKQDADALSVGLDILTLGRRLQTVNSLPTYFARGLDLHRVGCVALALALQTTSLSASDLFAAQGDFDQCEPSQSILRDAISHYYRFEKGLIAGPLSEDPVDLMIAGIMRERPGRLFFKPNATLSLFASSFRELRSEVMKAPYLHTDQISPRIGPPLRPNAFPGHPNYSGVKYANERIWSYVMVMDQQSLGAARHNLVKTLFGIRRYAASKGTVPTTLEALIPEIFETLPVDPYSGEKLVYDLANRVLYSVGTDLKADGGRSTGAPLDDDSEPTIPLGVN